MHCARCFFYESDVGDDTCNRCGRAYLPEANVYLGLVLLVTGGGAWTLRNLLTGQADPFVRPAADLGLWATWPVSLVNCPAYGLVIGAWLAMLAVAPILTGILYGKRGGWLTAIVIALLGPDLGLAAAAALGVWIAAGWTLRLQSKLASALLGLLPPAAYWFAAVALPGAGRAEPAALASPSAAATGALAPALRSLAYVPPITAVVIAAGAAALLVAVGRLDRWHVRWPAAVLAILVTAPVLAVPAFVGMDEIRYGLLQNPDPPSFGSSAVPLPQMDRLQTFLARHPSSPHAIEVRARLATDIERLSSGARSGAAPRRSEEIWQELLGRNPDSVWAADARVHLGDAAARQGLFVQAEEAYRRAIAQATLIAAPAGDPLAVFNPLDLFSIGKALKARADAEHLRAVRGDALTHLALILENRKDTQDNSRALARYFVAKAAAGTNTYRQRLQAVLEADPGGPLADNVAYDLAMAEVDNPKDLRRVEQLQKVIESCPKTDGALLARVAAARSLIPRAASDPGAPREARRYLEEAQGELARREATNPLDPYVAALSDTVKKELGYVRLQLRAPEKGR
ncbi:MAG: tetratricopeptide repeat protein [Planctomycetes bacterium]|nr:tetratricopeptide repeat protein [Planctomycetota bacterium]